jgi:hypothetical protein
MLLDLIRDQFLALLPAREDRHPWGRHNPRISDAVVFDRLVQVWSSARIRNAQPTTCARHHLRAVANEWIVAG